MKKKLFIVWLLGIFFGAQFLQAQQNLGGQLRTGLSGKQTFAEIMYVVDSFYLAQSEGIRNLGGNGLVKYKHWKKWEWETARSLGRNGQFVHKYNLNQQAIERRPRTTLGRSSLPGSWKQIGIGNSPYSVDTLNTYGQDTIPASYANGIGRVDRIAFHPSDPNTFYVATPYGGLWRTINGGVKWKCLTDQIVSTGIAGVVVDYANPNTLYILTGTAEYTTNSFINIFDLVAPSLGVLKSTNGGTTWSNTGNLPTSQGDSSYVCYKLIQSPSSSSTLFAVTSDGVFRTTNSATSWTKIKNGEHFDLEFKPDNGNYLYVSKNDSIFYSTNNGSSWTGSSVSSAISSNNNRIALGVSPDGNATVYALCGSATGNGSFRGLYRSTDAGVNFTQMATAPNILGYDPAGSDDSDQGKYDLCIAVDLTDSTRVALASINVWETLNGGSTYINKTIWHENDDSTKAYIHPDQHDIVYNPLNGNLYVCNDGGLYMSINKGTTWSNLSKGIYVSQFYHLAQFSGNSYKLVGGLQDNGIKYRAQGINDFVHIRGADGFSTSFSPHSADLFYQTVNSGADRARFSTGQFEGINPVGGFFKQILAHPVDTNIVFVGAANIHKSTNQGTVWSSNGGAGSWAMAFAPSDPTRMYAAGGDSFAPGTGAVFTSSNTGDTWTTISNNPGFPHDSVYNVVTDIAVNPGSPNEVYVSVGGFVSGSKVYWSNNFGQNWSNFSYDLPNTIVHSLAVLGDRVYAGTDISLFCRIFGASTWTDVGDNLPRTPITEILPDANTGSITIATFGRGVWRRDYCVDNITLTGDLEGKLEYSCNNILTSSSFIPGNNIDSMSFKAGGKILLLPGFQATKGTHFKTYHETCDNGPQPLSESPGTEIKPTSSAVLEKTSDGIGRE